MKKIPFSLFLEIFLHILAYPIRKEIILGEYMKRLFIGVKFSSDVNDYFKTSQLMVEKYCERANYTRYDNFHLTLKFLGMIEESRIDRIIEIINEVDVQRMELFFDHIGFFNKKGRYVIYMGSQPKVELTDYVMKLNDKLVNCSLIEKDEQIYTPHITLYRNAKILVPSVDVSRGMTIEYKANIRNVTLFESTNIDGVLTYRPLYTRELM